MKRILIIDDEPDLSLMLRLSLERTGEFEVRDINDPTTAVKEAKSFQPDLVLCDVNMPDMDGGDVAASLMEDPALKHIPVIFLTAMLQPEEVGKNNGRIGGRPYLAKPITSDALVAAIKEQLRS